MSDAEDLPLENIKQENQPFKKTALELRKERKRKKRKEKERGNDENGDSSAMETASESSTSQSHDALERKRGRKAVEEDDSSDSCCNDTDASASNSRTAQLKRSCKTLKIVAEKVSAPSTNNETFLVPTVRPQTKNPNPPQKSDPATAKVSSEIYARKASSLVDEVLHFCLDENRKIGKVQASFIMDRVSDLNRIITSLALRNNYLAGALEATQTFPNRATQTDRAPRPTPATAPTTAGPPTTATLSYASMAGKNLPAQRRGVARASQPHSALPHHSVGVPSTIPPLLAPNGVLPPPRTRAITEQVIAAARTAPVKHQVHIAPVNPADADSATTKSKLFKSIDFKKSQIGIKSVRPTRDGGIIIETPNARDLKIFTENSVLSNVGLKASAPKTELPRIVVRDIPKDLEAQDIAELIRAQNLQSSPAIDKSVLRPLFKVGRKDKEGNDWVIEVSNPIRESLLPREKIYVSYMHCRVSDYLVATRCYKCQKYGHVDKYCKSTELVCAFCAKTGHSNKECPNREKNPTCSNCRARQLPHNHSAGNRNCPSRSTALLQKASRINYS